MRDASNREDLHFSLDIVTNNSIYESHCDFFYIAKFDGRRIINEERNQEGRREEKGSPEEKG